MNSAKRLYKVFAVAAALAVIAILPGRSAFAITSFARQTGLPCSACHTMPPELTPFGRAFKLNGYTLTGLPQLTAKPAQQRSGLTVARELPVSIEIPFSFTATSTAVPGTQNGSFSIPQEIGLFFSGAVSSHAGTFTQITYDPRADHISLDMEDTRYANRTSLGGKDLVYGFDFTTAPTGEDLWNDTPVWGFPWIGSDAAPGPMAATLLDGTLTDDVGGVGAYAMWNDHLYGDVTVYRTAHLGADQPFDGAGFPYNIRGTAPYWRAAWQQTMGNNYLEVGTYGMHVVSSPNAVSGPEDTYTDLAADSQYERILPSLANDTISVHTTYIHERSDLLATYAAGSASFTAHDLSTYRLDGTYHWGNKYGATLGYFKTWGTVDPLLYAQDPVDGSANGDPGNAGYTASFSWWPVQNIEMALQYTGYTTFNGGSTNYDGAGRNASDNNAIYARVWFIF
ncbi:MAG: hypothetical protein KGN76_11510 [Acidobacteriota bacterium]|nr:hypothetical protein [Acidobacteriota bacterium]